MHIIFKKSTLQIANYIFLYFFTLLVNKNAGRLYQKTTKCVLKPCCLIFGLPATGIELLCSKKKC
ncbi:hypothetical protein C7N43_08735 [Sphingobacteriales bacterium UPWRP_1]|nr:hypothetical protein BVG80_10840 [Sphingobacteriales bacterium TSM_CSM]PSJ77416.1 hypothetical protein C7N43_08735 [Sphingobacteriales bacterium UPWRP_1]